LKGEEKIKVNGREHKGEHKKGIKKTVHEVQNEIIWKLKMYVFFVSVDIFKDDYFAKLISLS
jgi:hypothetical protein